MGIFSENGKLMQFVNRLLDVLLLNLLWLLFCLPVVTIGAATVAAFSVTLKMVDNEEGYVVRGFIKAFKENFRQGAILWLFNAAAVYALYLDWQIIAAADQPPIPLIVVGFLSAAFVFLAFVYAWPQVARYHNKLRHIIQNSVRICFRYPGRTFLLLAVLALEIFLFNWNTPMLVAGVLIGPMVLIYTVSGMSKRIFLAIDAHNQG